MTETLPLTPDAQRRLLRRVLQRAARARATVSPNPMVGAIIVAADGTIVGEGHHRRPGEPHAEIHALRAAGDRARGATMLVTLEPCCHHGRTPPCSDAVIAAGMTSLVAIHRDPNPRVAGGGFQRLREAGVAVSLVDDDDLRRDAVRLNWRFLPQQIHQRPAVTLKWAMSLDGRIATASGESQWISAPEGRRWALGEREHHDAILIGRGTAVTDDPRLDRRLGRALGPNLRVVLDRQLRIGPDARLFTVDGPICLYAEQPDGDDAATDAWRARRDALVARGAEVVVLVHVTPKTVLADLHTRGVQSVLVEGGGEVHGAFLAAGAFDRVAVDCAPRLIGGAGAPGPIGDPGFARLDDAPRLDSPRLLRRGGDVIMEAFHERCLPDLYASVDGS